MPRETDDIFPDVVAEYREFGYRDDDIACKLGIALESLYKRFAKFGIPRGRRWRDIEDAHIENTLTKSQIYGHRRAAS